MFSRNDAGKQGVTTDHLMMTGLNCSLQRLKALRLLYKNFSAPSAGAARGVLFRNMPSVIHGGSAYRFFRPFRLLFAHASRSSQGQATTIPLNRSNSWLKRLQQISGRVGRDVVLGKCIAHTTLHGRLRSQPGPKALSIIL